MLKVIDAPLLSDAGVIRALDPLEKVLHILLPCHHTGMKYRKISVL